MTHLLKLFRQSLARRKERQRQKRFEKARAVRTVVRSGLSPERKREAVARYRQGRFSRFRSKFKRERPVKRARFGTEAENQ